MTSIQKLVNDLQLKGIPVIKVIEEDFDYDAVIEITDDIHIQVGETYYGLCQYLPAEEAFKTLPYTKSLKKVVNQTAQLLEK